MGPRKVRLVIDMIRGKKVGDALNTLQFVHKAAAEPVIKILRSAMANAEHNFKLDPKTFRVAKITADGGPIAYRWQPHAFGRATPLRKRSTHLTIILSDGKQAAGTVEAKDEGKGKKKAGVKNAVKTIKKATKTKEDKVEKK